MKARACAFLILAHEYPLGPGDGIIFGVRLYGLNRLIEAPISTSVSSCD